MKGDVGLAPVVEKKKKTVIITKDTSDQEIIALDNKGYTLKFDEESFRVLGNEIIEALAHDNAREYWLGKGAFDALCKHDKRHEIVGDLEIVDPLKHKPVDKLAFKGVAKSDHVCWKRPDEVEEMKEIGYEILSNDDTSVVTRGASASGTSRVIKARDGKDDLVLMRIKPRDGKSGARLYQEHLEANAFESRKRAGATFDTLKQQAREASKNIRIIDETTDGPSLFVKEEIEKAKEE